MSQSESTDREPAERRRRPFRTVTGDSGSGLIVICDHASNFVPTELAGLGLSAADRLRHIAWDIGAAAVAEILAARFRAPAVSCGISRLVIDCNRSPADPAAMPQISDGTVVPGNRRISVWQRAERITRWFEPYHAEIERVIEAARSGGRDPVLLSVHSMTPMLQGVARPWPVALSWHEDQRLSAPLLAALRRRLGDTVGDNEPYGLDPAEDYSVPVHAVRRGLRHLQVEFRQDLVADAAGAAKWAQTFGDALAETLPEI